MPHSGPSEKGVEGGAGAAVPLQDSQDTCIPRCLRWAREPITMQDLEDALPAARDARRCDAGKPDVGGGGAYGWDVVHIAATRKQLRVLTLKNAEAILQAGECAQEYLYITGDVNKYFKYCGKRVFTWKNMGCKNLQEFEDDNDWSHTVLLHVATMTIHDPMFPKWREYEYAVMFGKGSYMARQSRQYHYIYCAGGSSGGGVAACAMEEGGSSSSGKSGGNVMEEDPSPSGGGVGWGVVLTQNLRESSRSFNGQLPPAGGARHRESHRRTMVNMGVLPPSQYNDTGSIDGDDMDVDAGTPLTMSRVPPPYSVPALEHGAH